MSSELFALSIPFRELAPIVDEWRERTCETKPSHGVAPHVTLLFPAASGTEAGVATLASFGPFDVTFPRCGRFPGVLWLAPEPAETFVAMTEALVAVYPDHPPYGGAFAGITPHLTVAQGDDLDPIERELASSLPLRARAVSVVHYERVAPDRWRERAEFEL